MQDYMSKNFTKIIHLKVFEKKNQQIIFGFYVAKTLAKFVSDGK